MKKTVFESLKSKLIAMGFLYHTPRSLLSYQDKRDIIQFGLIHFTFSENMSNILKDGVLPGKEALYRKEKIYVGFILTIPKTMKKSQYSKK